MVFAKHIRLAAIGTALLLSFAGQAQATFDFNSCIASCIYTSGGCQPDSARCMCKSARVLLLDSVVTCLFFNCKDDLRDFQPNFLEPIAAGCEDSGRDIPSSKIRAAASLATSYISKLPPLTTSAKHTTTITTPAAHKTTTTTPKTTPTSSTTTSSSSSSSTSTADDDSSASSTTAEVDDEPRTTAAPTWEAAPTTAAPSSSTSSRKPGSGSGASFDTDPFGTPGGSAGTAVRPLLSLLGLPMAVVVGLLAVR